MVFRMFIFFIFIKRAFERDIERECVCVYLYIKM